VVKARAIARGEVWLVALDSTIGSEIKKSRPCLIISPPDMHDHLRTVLAAPMTTASRPTPFRVPVRFQGKDGLILIDQARALDKSRLIRRQGRVEQKVLEATLATLRLAFEP
jgi:mRNA interferase MazF